MKKLFLLMLLVMSVTFANAQKLSKFYIKDNVLYAKLLNDKYDYLEACVYAIFKYANGTEETMVWVAVPAKNVKDIPLLRRNEQIDVRVDISPRSINYGTLPKTYKITFWWADNNIHSYYKKR
jgi:hypothetical protein